MASSMRETQCSERSLRQHSCTSNLWKSTKEAVPKTLFRATRLCSRRIPHPRFRRLFSELFRPWRHVPMIRPFSRPLNTTSSAMQRMPDLQQHAFTVCSPLAIPETQHLNILLAERIFSGEVLLTLPWQSMFKSVQLHCQASEGTVKIQIIICEEMLPSKFEARKSSGAQCLPKLFFFLSLLPSKTPCVPCWIHRFERRTASNKIKQQLHSPSPATMERTPRGGTARAFDHLQRSITQAQNELRSLTENMKRAPLLDPLPTRPSWGEGTSARVI
jgi:hypothetical protein